MQEAVRSLYGNVEEVLSVFLMKEAASESMSRSGLEISVRHLRRNVESPDVHLKLEKMSSIRRVTFYSCHFQPLTSHLKACWFFHIRKTEGERASLLRINAREGLK